MAAGIAAAGLAFGVAACSSERDSGDDADTFVFGTSSDPQALDPSLATDGETFRVSRQIFDTLVDHESGGTELTGGLAETYEPNEDGTVWTFNLRDNVTFHNGEDLTAETICMNFDRWYNWAGAYQSPDFSAYWQWIFGGFADNESDDTPEANYKSCTAEDELTAVIEIGEFSSNFPGGFSLAAFSIHSAESLEAYAAESAPSGEEGNYTYPESATSGENVYGTGPFQFSEWDRSNNQVILERFDEYWGEPAGVQELIFQTLQSNQSGRQALEAGDIDGYDFVAPQDVEALDEAGYNVAVRDVFNLLYLGMNQEGHESLAEDDVRTAIAHALNRQELVDTQLPPGSSVATQFMPDTVDGWTDEVPDYEYDPDASKELLADAGHEDMTIDFCYPPNADRPYLPSPQNIFDFVKEDLENVGITVEENAMEWTEYTDAISAGECSLYLLGWTGDFNEGFNFIGTWFAYYQESWGFENEDLFDNMAAANTEADTDTRVGMYEDLNVEIMEYLPGVPISSMPPAMAFSPDFNPPNVSPLTQENFEEITPA